MRFLMKQMIFGGVFLSFIFSLSSLWAQEKKGRIELLEITVTKGEKKGKIFKGDKLAEYSGGAEVSLWGRAFHLSGAITKVTINGQEGKIFYGQVKPGTHKINAGQVDFVVDHLSLEDGWTIKVVVHLKKGGTFSFQKEATGSDEGMDSLLEAEVKKKPVKKVAPSADSSSVLVSDGQKTSDKFKKDEMVHLKKYFIFSFQGLLAFLCLLGLLGILIQVPDLWKKEEGAEGAVAVEAAPVADEKPAAPAEESVKEPEAAEEKEEIAPVVEEKMEEKPEEAAKEEGKE